MPTLHWKQLELAKNQILQQASTAMLAQANASKQNVLGLLQANVVYSRTQAVKRLASCGPFLLLWI